MQIAASSHIPVSWMNWVTDNLARGVPPVEIDAILEANGFDPSMTSAEIESPAAISDHAEIAELGQKLGRLEALLRVYAKLWRECHGVARLDRIANLAGDAFFRWYYAANRPLVLLDTMPQCPALQQLTPDCLRERFGHEYVEVMTERDTDDHYEMNCERHKTTMPLAQFVDMVQSVVETNDFYMVANNRTLDNSGVRGLLNEIHGFDQILDDRNRAAKVFLWFGPAGTVTPLHHDSMNVLLAQALGRKLITLIPSFETPLVYNNVGVYSEVDCEAPDYERHPLFRYVSRLQVVLEPGQALFIPVGWWHHVRSLDLSISVSFTNFLAPNDYASEFGRYGG